MNFLPWDRLGVCFDYAGQEDRTAAIIIIGFCEDVVTMHAVFGMGTLIYKVRHLFCCQKSRELSDFAAFRVLGGLRALHFPIARLSQETRVLRRDVLL